ncbi:hypothetical protein [Marixanthomonas spongiae]|uniref:Uncharacterized protein n=1 Tax=Marixanthomonas spongiae TaxID=2174845 RepID=A0A2U0I7U2_9FLAO|nr:hypothetical protein [Marixanthomonas spongiae]PVW17120.1 hypothetical protein DDV96_00960 [Marixanthomonas spongiae]
MLRFLRGTGSETNVFLPVFYSRVGGNPILKAAFYFSSPFLGEVPDRAEGFKYDNCPIENKEVT